MKKSRSMISTSAVCRWDDMRCHSSSTSAVALCCGLLRDQACKCVVLPSCPHALVTNGWNSPVILHPDEMPDTVTQISLGWTKALLLTQDGAVFVADASNVYNSQRKYDQTPQTLCIQQQQEGQASINCSIWQAVKLQGSCSSLDNSLSAAIAVVQVAAADLHCLLLDSAGRVWSMGSNKNGQLGLAGLQQPLQDEQAAPQQMLAAAAAARQASSAGSTTHCESSTKQQRQLEMQQEQKQQEVQQHESSNAVALQERPVCVLGPGSPSSCQEPIKQIAAGGCHSAAITADLGRLYCWGWNAHGQCGTGNTADVPQPTLCTALDGVPLACVAAGMAHTVVASRDGAVYATGWNSNGQLGLAHDSAAQQQASRLVPVLVEHALLDQEHVAQVACGSRHTVVLTASGGVFAWGLNTYGQCCTSLPSAVSPASTLHRTGQMGLSAVSADNDADDARPTAAAVVASTATCSVAAAAADVLEPRLVVLPATVAMPAHELLSETATSTGLPKDAQATAGAANEQRQTSKSICVNWQQQQQQQQHECGARASILVQVGKAVAVSAGGWHTFIRVNIGGQAVTR